LRKLPVALNLAAGGRNGAAREVRMFAASIDRRDFLRRTAAWGTALPFIGFAGRAAALPADLVARRIFFDNPDYNRVSISPDGQHLAYLAPVDGVSNLWVTPVADPGRDSR
jgi:hypothetical protein